MAASSFSGTVVAVSANVPGTFDAAGFGALSYTVVDAVISWAEVGDDHPDIAVPLLARTRHVSGPPDGGSRAFSYQFEAADPGQNILRTNNGSNTDISFKITLPGGAIRYYSGRVANMKMSEINNNSFIGEAGEVRVNSAVIRV
jgi:hypothetical protein